ncbi:ABC transporter substrate-binding protein [Bacillaceae bacterium Marseille-Q3522]|nr:ABC transporter substrate-binding protein [Bacillaceae bacterium Marseille-Q3522]
MKKRILLLFICFLFVFAGCSQKPASNSGNGSETQTGGTITVTSVREPDTLDVQRTTWVDDANSHLYEPLVKFDFEGNIVPALAESYEVSPDGLVITFKLKENSKFHTGTPVTAEAIKKSFDLMKTARTSYMLGTLSEVVAVDDLTAEFHFSEPFAPFLSNATTAYLAPLDPSVIDEYGEDFGTHASSTGILKLSEIKRGSSITYESYDDYNAAPDYVENKGAANFDKVVFRFIPDDDTRMLEFKSGKSQVMLSVPPSYISQLESDPNVTLERTLANGITYLGFNNEKPIFQDKRIRQAIALAIDRTPIVDYTLEGAAQPIFGPLPPTIPGYSQEIEDAAAEKYALDIDEAKSLLAEAGYTETNSSGIVMKDGQPLSIEIWVTQEPTNQRIAQVLQEQLKAAGIELRITVQEDATIRAQTPEGLHEMILWTYGWYDADILHSLYGRGLSTRVHYQNDELISILEKARVTVEPKERIDLYKLAQEILVEESPWVPLYVRQNVVAYRDLEGFKLHPMTGGIIWSDVELKK